MCLVSGELLGLYNVLSANIPTEWEKDGSTDHDFAVLGLDKPVVLPGGMSAAVPSLLVKKPSWQFLD